MTRSLIVRAIIEHDGEFLFVQHKGHSTWNLPGGHVDDNEDVLCAIKRELMEELGVAAEVGAICYVQHLFLPQNKDSHEGGERLELFFHITNGEDFRVLELDKTSHAALEISEAKFFAPGTIETRPAFLREELRTFDPCSAVKLRIEHVQ